MVPQGSLAMNNIHITHSDFTPKNIEILSINNMESAAFLSKYVWAVVIFSVFFPQPTTSRDSLQQQGSRMEDLAPNYIPHFSD